MPSPRAVAGIAAALVGLGLVGLAAGAMFLVANTGSGAVGGVLLIGGLAAVLGGVHLLTRGRAARTRARTTVPGMRPSTSMLPGGALFFVGVVLGAVGLRGASWLFVPAAIAGVAGAILFARSGSPDEPA
jgi:hypothetical protein